MGEKVYVTSGPPIDPPKATAPREPLNYARPGIAPRYSERIHGLIRLLGGGPQVIFASGLGITLGVFAIGLTRVPESAFWAFVGGAMMGVVLRVPLRKDF